jgi:hypothetical protein
MMTIIDTVITIITTMTSVEIRQVHWTRHDLGVLPPPLWGRGGEGASCCCTSRVRQLLPPPLTPPQRKSGLPDLRSISRDPGKPGARGEGNTEPAANLCPRGTLQ